MSLLIETLEEKQKILIVTKKHYPFIDLLKSELKKYGAEVFSSPRLTKSFPSFDYYFFIDQGEDRDKIKIKISLPGFKNPKIIHVTGENLRNEDIDRILWFAFSRASETHLTLSAPKLKRPSLSNQKHSIFHFVTTMNRKRLLFFLISVFIIFHLLFIPPLILSSYFIYQEISSFNKEDINKANESLRFSLPLLKISKKFYSFSRPTLLLFSLALVPDSIIDINERANISIQQSLLASQNIGQIEKMIFKKDKSSQEKDLMSLRIKKLKDEISIIDENLTVLNQKLPPWSNFFKKTKNQLGELNDSISRFKKILPYIDNLLAGESEKKYLLLFANNMELRPGGGFLGSFGVLKIKDYTIDDIQVYDVYDADGQLIAHVDPPEPIRKYLQIPHGFLRDSNFSPDFLDNYIKAKFFLEKEINLTDFSGSFLITTTAIENLLGAFGDLYLPDFNENVNQKNFYLKAQLHAEKDFFPGSIQKKTFLSSLTRQLIINLDRASIKKIAAGLKKSLDEKQIVMYLDEPNIQSLIDSFYWSGRVIEPKCTSQLPNCVVDYLFPYDANVGANKVNFFINRSMDFKTMVDSSGNIRHILSIQYKNESPSEVFPGGIYRNYFETLLPVNSSIKRITKDGTLVEDYDEKQERLKTVGFYFEVEPKRISEIKIEYQLSTKIPKGRGIYQLIIQKQTGAANTDYVLEFSLPKNVYLINQNFSPLVKDDTIVYNTTLSADKIFFMELTKE